MNNLMNWSNMKCFVKKTNRTEFTATNVIAKMYGKGKK
jgi:hypothetical protein